MVYKSSFKPFFGDIAEKKLIVSRAHVWFSLRVLSIFKSASFFIIFLLGKAYVFYKRYVLFYNLHVFFSLASHYSYFECMIWGYRDKTMKDKLIFTQLLCVEL